MNYIDWIRTLPCGHCVRQKYPTERHHFKSDLHMSGSGMKSPDHFAIPLCIECHRRFHGATWQGDRLHDQRGILILTWAMAVEAGIITFGEIQEPWQRSF